MNVYSGTEVSMNKVDILARGTVMAAAGEYPYFGWPTAARLPEGTVMTVCSGFRMGHICPFGRVAAAYSADDGRTWSAPETIFDTPLDDRDAGLAVSGGRVMVTTFNNTRAFQRRWNEWNAADTQARISAYLDTVTDAQEAEAFGSHVLIRTAPGEPFRPAGKVFVTAPHGPAVLSDGTFFYIGRKFMPDSEAADGEGDGIYVIRSADGIRWSQPVAVPMPAVADGVILCEPHAAELPSGRIVAGVRASKGNEIFATYTAVSDDGATFTPFVKTFEGAPPHFTVLRDGRMVCTYGYRQPPFGIRAAFSADGVHWSDPVVLTDDGPGWDLGYPSTVERRDGTCLTVYYQAAPTGGAAIEYVVWKPYP